MKLELSEQAKLARREYAKKWRDQHRENVKAAQERYWEKRAREAEAEAAANAADL